MESLPLTLDAKDVAWLTKYIDTRFEGSDRIHASEREADKRAIELAREDMSRRLHDMNMFRDDIKEDRVVYVSRVEVDTKLQSLTGTVASLELRVRGLENRLAWMGGAIALLLVLTQFLARFWH